MSRIPVHNIQDHRLAPYRELSQRNLTRFSGLFIAEGDKVVERLISSRYPVASLLAEPAYADRYAPLLPAETPLYVAERATLEATIGFNFHRGVLACGRRIPGPTVTEIPTAEPVSTILVSPGIQDPTNLGSIIRSAAAFGCSAVVLGSHCADPFSRRVLRVSMGTALHLPIVESPHLAADLRRLSGAGYELVATVLDPSAQPLATFCPPARLALLLGGEGHGLAGEWLELCSRQVTIPMQLGIDSLNVAVAAAVLLYHCQGRRPRQSSGSQRGE
jgi:tRNA G18 (ribose-2'-O)-methylase SpoU